MLSVTNNASDFFEKYRQVPENSFWQLLDDLQNEGQLVKKMSAIKQLIAQTTTGKKIIETDAKFGYLEVPEPLPGLPAARTSLETYSREPGSNFGTVDDNPFTTGGNTFVQSTINQLNYDAGVINNYHSQGLYPVPIKNLFGDIKLEFIKKKPPQPEIFVAIQFKVQSFLGNYGAGKVVKTMSLMPGEKTTITVKTYKEQTESLRHADNVLDSFSKSSSDSLEKLFESENSETKTKSGGFSLGIAIKGFNLGGGASKGTTSASKTINRTLNKHVEESQAQRKVEVNTETNSTNKEGEETSITRELKNINLSRVLNFTFRQMNQEYIVVTYIDDVSLVYSNGYPESVQVARLHDMDEFLATYLQDPAKIEEYKQKIIMSVYNLKDYTGQRKDCFKQQTLTSVVPPALTGIINPENYTYWAKDETFKQTVPNTTFSVPGIITQIERHTLSTDSVVAEALLGQGESLDCYNILLQNEAARKTRLDSVEQLQKLEVIENFVEQGRLDEKALETLYGKCCTEKTEG
jgi:hypothetical protein